jgi:acetylornithine/succinyldiaminopimelate/putrescine aminotransferase
MDLMLNTQVDHEVPVYSRIDMEVAEGSGVNVCTSKGQELIDFYGGHAVALLGYRHPVLLATLREQAERLFFQTNLVDVRVRTQAHNDLASFGPKGLDRVFLVNSGAEANENALRVAFKMRPGRDKVITLEGGFHGRTAAAGACTAGALSKWYGFPRTPFDVVTVPVNSASALESALDERTAAVILEPIQGIAGCVDLSIEYLRQARALTTKFGALLIADEVQCGMGRSGYPFAIMAADVVPDFITTAKGIAGGFPAAALLTTSEIASTLKAGDLGTTFGGGPMACALISAIVHEIQTKGFLDHVREMGKRIEQTCVVGPVTAIQGRGLLLGLRCNRPVKELLTALQRRGILAGGSSDPYIIRLTPPLIIRASHVDALARALASLPKDPNEPVS